MTRFVEAKNYTATSGRQIDLLVIHDMEAPEKPTTAEAVANWFAGANAPRASAHRCFDNNSQVQCVRDKDVAWHAPGANHNGLGYELAGYAAQTRTEWLDAYGKAMLRLVAKQARADCDSYNIPVRFVDADGLRRGERGITTHWEVTKAFRRSTHTDPGVWFPMAYFLSLIDGQPRIDLPTPPSPVAVDDGLLRRGDRGAEVEGWQRICSGFGHDITVDGVFGPQTEAVTRRVQATVGVTADGIVGPQTREAVAKLLAWLKAVEQARDTPDVPPFLGTVRRGSRGSTVTAVQRRLRERGWRITVDGIYGPKTEQVVRAFQQEKGLQADGIAGPQTWRAIWIAPIT